MSASSLVDAFGRVSAFCPGQMVAYGTSALSDVSGVAMTPQIVPGAGATSWSAQSPLVVVPQGPLLGTLTITKTIQPTGSYFVVRSSNAADVTPISWWLYSTLPTNFV